MSVYIPGMELPKNCPCELVGIGYDLYCSFTGGNPSRVEEYYECCNNDSRPDWCPLVEVPPHGDLFDRDLLEVVSYHNREGTEDDTFDAGVRWLLEYIDGLLPVIPADREDARC